MSEIERSRVVYNAVGCVSDVWDDVRGCIGCRNDVLVCVLHVYPCVVCFAMTQHTNTFVFASVYL